MTILASVVSIGDGAFASMMEASPKTSRPMRHATRWIVVSLICVFVVALWFGNWILLEHVLPASTDGQEGSHLGAFGDRFGAVNALFSGLAFVGVIFAIWLQRDELKLQRQSNQDTRRELEIQNTYNARREFQTTFFDMLRALQDTVDLIAINRQVPTDPLNPPAFPQPERWVNGRTALAIVSATLQEHMKTHLTNKSVRSTDDEALLNRVASVYELFYRDYGYLLGHYFRMMYQIARFIDSAPIGSTSDRLIFARILRAQLSQPEMILLCYNCLSHHGYEKFHPLVERYDLLQNFERDAVPSRLWDLYPVTRDTCPPLSKTLTLNGRADRFVSNDVTPESRAQII